MATYEDFGQEMNFAYLKSLFFNIRANNINQLRCSLQQSLNGKAFYPIYAWPLNIQLMFSNTPLSDSQTFQFLLFMYGNGCPPTLCMECLCTSYFYAPHKTLKRLYQIKWICANFTNKRHIWYYHNMELDTYMYLNGTELPRNPINHEIEESIFPI